MAATLADVPAGARVRVTGTAMNGVLNATTVTVVTMWPFTVVGTITAVDTVDATVTVAQGRQAVTVPVDPAARIQQNNRTVTLSGLIRGATVRVSGKATNGVQNATRIDATAKFARR